jgi:hypothetical protein
MAFTRSVGLVVLALMTSTSTRGQALSPNKLSVDLKTALSLMQQNNCPPAMSPMVKEACQQQLSYTSNRLRVLGRVTSTTYLGTQQVRSPSLNRDVPAALFRVTFQSGGTTTWTIAEDEHGQITVFWTPGF